MQTSPSPEIHERVRSLVDATGFKRKAFAQRMGVSESWLSDRLTGRVKILAEELPGFAAALRCSPCDFFEEARPPWEPTLGDHLGAESVQFLTGMNPKRRALLLGMARLMEDTGVE